MHAELSAQGVLSVSASDGARSWDGRASEAELGGRGRVAGVTGARGAVVREALEGRGGVGVGGGVVTVWVRWGEEFGVEEVALNIAEVDVRDGVPGAARFLEDVFGRFGAARAELKKVRERAEGVGIEVDGLEEAAALVEEDVVARRNSRRIAAFAEQLNRYKGICKSRRTARA